MSETIKIPSTGFIILSAGEAVYRRLSKVVDDSKGYPKGLGGLGVTEHGLPDYDHLVKDFEGEGGVVTLHIEPWRITKDLQKVVDQAVSAGQITDLTVYVQVDNSIL